MQQNTYIFFGRSGSGKGTQAQMLRQYIEDNGGRTIYIETGDRFRSFMETGSYTAGMTKKVIASGGLMPVFMPIWLWANELVHSYTGYESLILDGLCRRIDEAPVLDSALKFYGIEKAHVIYINVSNDWAANRLQGRGRSDDSAEYINSRMAWFDREVLPVLEYFRDRNRYAFHEINGEQSIESVHADIRSALELA